MMATTHALVGVLVGLALAPLAPESAVSIALAGGLGGFAPDIDAVRAHRRALHLPVLGTAVGVALGGVAVWTAAPIVVALAAFVLAAGLHAASDVLDGGLSLRPWADRPERAVYCHVQGRWWRPRRVLAYDGSPGDLALAAGLALPALALAGSETVRGLVGLLLVVSIAYAALRKRIPDLVAAVGDKLEERLGVRPSRTR